MSFIELPLCCKVEMRYTQHGQQMENVYHVQHESGWNEARLNTLGGIFESWENTQAKGLRATSVTWTAAVLTSQEFEAAPGVEYVTGAPINGTDAGVDLPGNVTVAVRWITGLRGRSYRGRTFHIGLTRARVSGDAVIPTDQALIATCYNNLIGALDAEAMALVVASYRHNKAPRAVGLASPITTATVEHTIDSQRRRLSGRGA